MEYKDSALRHFDDGKILFEKSRYDNADQLFGFAAECAIKACLPKRCFKENTPQKGFKVHINNLWSIASIHINAKSHPGLIALLKVANPFATWSVDARYHPTGNVTSEVCKDHFDVSRRLLGAARLYGRRRNI